MLPVPFIQENRILSVTTPLGEDVVLLQRLSGYEGISSLFRFQLELLAENRELVQFDKLLGQSVTVQVAVPTAPIRFFNGIAIKVTQGHRDERFTQYAIETVPEFWLLTKRVQSRIFQH